jgi:ribosome maturation factor RimP
VATSTGSAGLGEAIEGIVLPVVREHGLILVDVDVRGSGRRMVVRIFVDKDGGVTIDDCRRLSQEVGDLIDVANIVPGGYDLEVSSPGLDRQLHREREFRWATGKLVRVWTREPVGDARELVGRLDAVDADVLILTEEPGGSRTVPRSLVTKARLEMEPRGSA